MSVQYRLRKKGNEFGGAEALPSTLKGIRARLKLAGGPYRIKRPGEGYGPEKPLYQVMAILAWNLPRAKPEDTWRIKTPKTTFSIRVEDATVFVPDGPGTLAIDRIHAATIAFCDEKGWPVAELGICVDKPGEHGNCNAWDGGCSYQDGKLLSAEEIHRRILVVANFLKDEGTKNIRDRNEGLPINGVIVMEQFWSRAEATSGWQRYTGTPHVSHWHVSGFPGTVPGWI